MPSGEALRRVGPPRMSEVAERAGVSTKTVSAVVNGVGQVRPETRDRVRAAIEALGFRPNPAARRLRSGRSGAITLALPHLGSGDMAVLASAVIGEAEHVGLAVLCVPTGGATSESDALRSVLGVSDGVLLMPAGPSFTVPGHGPVVVLGDRPVSLPIDQVVSPAEISILRAVDVIGRQPGDILLIIPDGVADLVPASFSGTVLRTRDESAGAGFAAVHEMSDVGTTAHGVVTFGSGLGIGAAHAIRDSDLTVPDDLRLVSIGGGVESAFADPTITTVAPDVPMMAARAVSWLLERVAGIAPDEPRREDVPLVVESRGSTAS